MKSNSQYNIALVLYTSGLDYDDRIRKEILSIKELYPNIDFKIFAIEPENREEEGVTSYGVPYRIPYLKSRDKYASGTHTIRKAWDLYHTVKNDLKGFDAVWCADPETALIVLMLHSKPVAWDLHELPIAFMNSPIKRRIFKYLESKCKVIVHANKERMQLIHEMGMITNLNSHFYLRNYPQFNECDSEYDDIFNDFIAWKGGDRCVYLQGISSETRADIESLGAVLAIDSLKVVVVGKVMPERMKIIEDKFGEELLKERVFFTGQIKQLKTPQFIKQCDLSLVFYKNTSPNNWLCEPNRMFQSVINGVPVVVGNNPTMKDFVETNGFGVCVNSDGSDIEKITEGVKLVLSCVDEYKNKCKCDATHLMWDSQKTTLKDIVNKLLDE